MAYADLVSGMARKTNSGNPSLRLCFLLLALIVSGCTKLASEYTISQQNIEAAREVPSNLVLGAFTGSEAREQCRGGSISAGKNATFATYVRDAFSKVIRISKQADKGKTIELTGSLKEIELVCAISDASWTIDMDFAVDGQDPFNVRIVQPFDGHFVGAVVFQRALDALIVTVQQIVDEVLRSEQVQSAAI